MTKSAVATPLNGTDHNRSDVAEAAKNAVTTKRNIAMLTWIRGIAAFFVVIGHIKQAAWVPYVNETLEYPKDSSPLFVKLFSMGQFGVTLFFVLSGCTLYLGYNGLKTTQEATWNFYLRRFARIYPAFVVSLICYLAFRPLFQELYVSRVGNWVEDQFFAGYDFKTLVQYLTLTSNFRMEEAIFNNAYWSLPTEFQFYLLFPLLLVLNRRWSVISIMAFCGLLYVLTIIFKWDEFNTTGMLWEFGGGMLCGYFYIKKPFAIHWVVGIVVLFILYVVMYLVQVVPAPVFPGVYIPTYLGIIAIVVVYTCVNINMPDFKNWLVNILNWQGEVSYSIYLFHNLFVAMWLLVALHYNVVGVARVLLIGVGTMLCTYPLAHFSYKWVEKPGMDLGKRLTAKPALKPRLQQ